MERIRTLAAERVNEAIRTDPVKRYGRVVRSSGDVLRASGIRAPSTRLGSPAHYSMSVGAQISIMPLLGSDGLPWSTISRVSRRTG